RVHAGTRLVATILMELRVRLDTEEPGRDRETHRALGPSRQLQPARADPFVVPPAQAVLCSRWSSAALSWESCGVPISSALIGGECAALRSAGDLVWSVVVAPSRPGFLNAPLSSFSESISAPATCWSFGASTSMSGVMPSPWIER